MGEGQCSVQTPSHIQRQVHRTEDPGGLNFAWNRGGMKGEEDRKYFLNNLDSLFNIASCSQEASPAQSQGVRDVRRGHTCRTVTV